MALSGLYNFFMPVSVIANTSCEFRQNLLMGQEYYIYNNEYPGNYSPSTICTWIGRSPSGTRIVIACDDIALPSTKNCVGDKLSISLSGDESFKDSRNYCGIGSVSLVTTGNSLAVGLFTTATSPTGRFICSLAAIKDSDSSTPPTPRECDCGLQQGTRIVGGVETMVNEFPSMAALVNTVTRSVFCGGSIISKRYVLTAAHCLPLVKLEDLGILVGDHNISAKYETAAAALYRVSYSETHPRFDNGTLVNDLAILKTAVDMKFNLYVGPVCLPFRYTTWDFEGQKVTALGWGQIFYTGPQSDVLMKVDLTVTSNLLCSQENSASIITPGQICTYVPGKDACQSDSGGPLLWMDPEKRRLQLVGIISYGLGCATGRPAINTRTTAYISWIVSRTNDANYCIK